jgi:hypothetical protein
VFEAQFSALKKTVKFGVICHTAAWTWCIREYRGIAEKDEREQVKRSKGEKDKGKRKREKRKEEKKNKIKCGIGIPETSIYRKNEKHVFDS